MDWQSLTRPEILKFILDHEQEDIAALALKKSPSPEWDYRLVLEQIKARGKARKKVPSWFEAPLEAVQALVFPPSETVEQASSEATALYKAALVAGESFADLSGGMGVDCLAFSRHFRRGFCVERDETAAALLAHNLSILKAGHVEVFCRNAQDFLYDTTRLDFIYIDPQRRDAAQKGKFRLEDASPDVLALLPLLKERARRIMLKTSPMLDISDSIEKLGHVHAVHVVEHRGECREVLYLLDMGKDALPPGDVPVTATEIGADGQPLRSFSFTARAEWEQIAPLSPPLDYLYEPGPAFQKAGGFSAMALHYGVNKLHQHTHLYTSAAPCPDFPGRGFKICGLYPVQAGKIPLEKANLALRNFPGDVETLRKKLKLKDGGADYLFACTLVNGDKALIHGRKP